VLLAFGATLFNNRRVIAVMIAGESSTIVQPSLRARIRDPAGGDV
jgi:hypothetical protein